MTPDADPTAETTTDAAAPVADGADVGAAPAPTLPAWRRIADDMLAAMASGELKPGDALPTAVQLAERYAVHRHTVRQAFHFLAEQGKVTVQQGRGTFVIEPRAPYRIGRRVSFRANLAASGKTTSGTVVGHMMQQAAGIVAGRLRVPEGTPLWCVRTLSIAGGLPMSTSLHYLEAARFPDFPARLIEAAGSMSRAFGRYNIGAYERLSTRLVARAATDEEAVLLSLMPGAPVLHSSGVDGFADGRVLQLAETAFAGERMEMVIEPEEPHEAR